MELSKFELLKTKYQFTIPLHRSTCRGWSWSGPYASPSYACYLTQSKIDFESADSNDSFISGPKNCTDTSLNVNGKGGLFRKFFAKVFQNTIDKRC